MVQIEINHGVRGTLVFIDGQLQDPRMNGHILGVLAIIQKIREQYSGRRQVCENFIQVLRLSQQRIISWDECVSRAHFLFQDNQEIKNMFDALCHNAHRLQRLFREEAEMQQYF